MFHILYGRSGSGKTDHLLGVMSRRHMLQQGAQLYLVPETASHETERRICHALGNSASLDCEVVTFRRLCRRVFASLGGMAALTPDGGAQILLMYRAWEQSRASLSVYGTNRRGSDLLQELLRLYEECRSGCITPQALAQTAENCESALAGKLRDLSVIFSAYEQLQRDVLMDPRDELARTEALLRDSTLFEGATLYIDGFEGFTPRERTILEVLMERCHEVYAAFTLDDPGNPDSVFGKCIRTAAALERMAQLHGHAVSWRRMPDAPRSPGLAQLEEYFEDYTAACWNEVCDDVTLHTALNPFSECEYVACMILRLVRQRGLRFRDFAVVTPDPGSLRTVVEAVFERCGVPLFVSDKTDMLSRNLIALVMAALETVSGGFEAEDLLRYLKTGLTDICDEDADRLENYILRWKLRGRAFESDWDMNPDGLTAEETPETQAALARLNELRRTLCTPLLTLRQGLRDAPCVAGKAQALYDFLEAIDLPAACLARAAFFEERGDRAQADELRQLWDILCRALDSLVETAGELRADMELFCQLTGLVLGQYDVGVIPSSLDRVHFGGLESAGHPQVLFLIGASDDAQQLTGGGILTDRDRDVLDALGLELQFTAQSRSDAERFALYRALSAPRSLLHISHAAFSASGSVQRPGIVFSRVKDLLSCVTTTTETPGNADFRLEAPIPALEYALTGTTPAALAARDYFSKAPEYAHTLGSLRSHAGTPRGPIASPALRRSLYGSAPRLSASGVDAYYECPYKYFARYGLQLKARRPAAFDAPESGLYLHYVLENTVREIEQRFGSWKQAQLADVLSIGQSFSDRYVNEKLGGLRGRSARFIHLFHRVQRTLTRLLSELYAEFSLSGFHPMDFELDFSLSSTLGAVEIPLGGGVTATLSGKVDRVDGWLHNGALYLRVVDYKSGRKDFSLTEIAAGIGMQLPLYLYVLGQQQSSYRQLHPELPEDVRLQPAGILYAPINAPVHSAPADLSAEELTRELLKKSSRKGLLLGDEAVLQAMEPGLAGRFIPVTVNAKKQLSTRHTATEQQLTALGNHVRRLLRQMGQELCAGNTAASPRYLDSTRTGCDLCDYRSVCHFDPTSPDDRIRKLSKTDLDGITGQEEQS